MECTQVWYGFPKAQRGVKAMTARLESGTGMSVYFGTGETNKKDPPHTEDSRLWEGTGLEVRFKMG